VLWTHPFGLDQPETRKITSPLLVWSYAADLWIAESTFCKYGINSNGLERRERAVAVPKMHVYSDSDLT